MGDLISIRLPEKIYRELEIFSKLEGKPKSEIVREALNQYFAIKKFRYLRKKVIPFAEAKKLLTDEDIFKLIS